MKITRIDDVYTVPKTEADLETFTNKQSITVIGDIVVYDTYGVLENKEHILQTRTEIPVDQFLDLLNDKIADWRCFEVGFTIETQEEFYLAEYNEDGNVIWDISIYLNNWIQLSGIYLTITTFTELLQQMKFLGWKNGVE